MPEPVDLLERRIDALRAEIRRAVAARDTARTRGLRAELRAAERAWEQAITDLAEETGGEPAEAVPGVGVPGVLPPIRSGSPMSSSSLVPVREQVHHALTLLSVPAAPKLIAEVHAAFFGAPGTGLAANRLTHLRRDEKRSFETAPYARPYHLCAALTAAHLAPARGLIAVSTWSLERRIVGPLSPRVDFLTAAVRVAQRAGTVPDGNVPVTRLLWRFATNIPGATGSPGMFDRHDTVDPQTVIRAAEAERAVHADADRTQRAAAADRARRQLDDVQQLFGSTLRTLQGKTA
ncbi:hypothetical protein [Plantactinospora sp. KLBMP9567]|uniref:hypothetical protein n=1 Tax=Plantactinospora sp. KLBMP9567 TaxID=3085900 RepID=UPI00298166FF|nr:hypothetical protein [Plantactinospora sp. KLBMP9567]MDW5328673.1 hypothetical protein [Plantactinospora sp. KLBMP9567]